MGGRKAGAMEVRSDGSQDDEMIAEGREGKDKRTSTAEEEKGKTERDERSQRSAAKERRSGGPSNAHSCSAHTVRRGPDNLD